MHGEQGIGIGQCAVTHIFNFIVISWDGEFVFVPSAAVPVPVPVPEQQD